MENEAKHLIRYFGNLYHDAVGERYPPTWGRDSKLFSDMLKQYPVERIERFLDLYFQKRAKIYAIPFFKASLGELVQREVEEGKNKPKQLENDEAWRFA